MVIAILVQPADLDRFLLPLQLAFHHLMIRAAVALDAETAVRPQLSFGAEAVRGLHNAQQHGRPDRADRRNLMEPFPDLVLLALHQQILPDYPSQRPQPIQLLVIVLGPPAHPRFADFLEPRGAVARAIDLCTAARNPPSCDRWPSPGS